MNFSLKKLIILAVIMFAASVSASAQKAAVSTNFADFAFLGTVNAEAQYAVAQNWSVALSGGYNPWTYNSSDVDRQFQRRRRNVSVGARWWPWHVYSGWWLSADARWQEYNEARVFTKEVTAEEGDRFGLRIGGGYTVRINSWLNVDFGFRGWGGYTYYTVYACPSCGRIIESGGKPFILPDEAVVSLMFVF